MSLDVSPDTKRGPFLFIGVIALVSLGLAYGLFWLVSSGVLSFGTTNHGKFVEPRTLANSFHLVGEQGDAFETHGNWSLWLVSSETCGSSCWRRLEDLRKLQVLLHRDATRVRRYLLVPRIQSLPEENAQLKQFVAVNQLAEGVYIVDPLGQLVLHYDVGAELADILEDLKRLLKVSQIG